MKNFTTTLFLILTGLLACAQNPADIDPTFNNTGMFANSGAVRAIATQSDGKIIAAGTFNYYHGSVANYIVRLNQDGSVDNAFTTGTGFDSTVNTVAIQSDGKIIVGGIFTGYNNNPANHIVRLNTDGSIDNTFNTGSGFSNSLTALQVQADGKILAIGAFTSYNGSGSNRIVRLNTDGSKDMDFNLGINVGSLYTIALQSDGKILIAGSSSGGTNPQNIRRLNSDGSLDTSFTAITMIRVNTLAIQSDGKIIAAGIFYLNGRNCIARLNIDGSIDPSFGFGSGDGFNDTVNSVSIQSDGKITAVGEFTSYNGNEANHVARIDTFGYQDMSFDSGSGPDSHIYTVASLPNEKTLIGGDFSSYDQTTADSLLRVNTNGNADNTFTLGIVLYTAAVANDMVIQSDGKIVVSGRFRYHDSVVVNGIIRLNNDGSRDNSFQSGSGLKFNYDTQFFKLIQQPDGKIIIYGHFSEYNGNSANYIVRLNEDGSIDSTFSPPGNDFWIIDRQPDGKFICNEIGGNIDKIVRLNSNGSPDTSFSETNLTFEEEILSMVCLPDGKIMVGGYFDTATGSVANGLYRLNSDGTVDNTFVSPFESGTNLSTFAVMPSGKIVLSTDTGLMYCLNSNGSIDTTFTGQGFGQLEWVWEIFPLSNEKVLVGGVFDGYGTSVSNNIAQLTDTGIADFSFDAGSGFNNGGVRAFAKQADGKVLVSGLFSSYNGQIAKQIVRLKADSTLSTPAFSNHSTFTIYPNPVKDNLFFNMPEDEPIISFEIADITGKTVISNLEPISNVIDVSHFSKGVYFIKTKTTSGESIQKFLKE